MINKITPDHNKAIIQMVLLWLGVILLIIVAKGNIVSHFHWTLFL